MKTTFENQNPWRKINYSFPDEDYILRTILDKLIAHLTKQEVTIIVGSRQVGKTFLLKKLIEYLLKQIKIDRRQIFYFNFDALDLIEFFQNEKDFLDFIVTYGISEKKNYIFLDEAQRIDNCGLLIKRYYDLGLNIKFIVSGSSSLELKSQVKETLTGRKRLFELYPISFKEFSNFKGIDAAIPFEKKIKFESTKYLKLLNEFILFGGYPGVVKLTQPEEKILLLKEIYQSYIQKDISDFLNVSDVIGFNKLVKLLSSQFANLMKVNELSKVLGLSRYNIERFIHFLQETYIINVLQPYYRNIGKSLIKTPKLYFIDTGIRNVVFDQFQELDNRLDSGQLIENFVFSEIIKEINLGNLWFFRTSRGTEVDFLFDLGNSIIPIEVKYSEKKQKSIPKAFNTLLQTLNVEKAYVLTKDYLNEKQFANIPVFFRPAWDIPFEDLI